jgi:hypothetical protein
MNWEYLRTTPETLVVLFPDMASVATISRTKEAGAEANVDL